MKKYVPAITALAGTVLIAAFLAWAFSLHGTIGLYRVNGVLHSLFLYLGVFGLVLLVLSLLYILLKVKVKNLKMWWLTILLFVLAVPGIIVPPLAFAYTGGLFSGSIGDTPPQLLIMDGVGANGIPNIAVTFNTAEPSRNTFTWGRAGSLSTLNENTAIKQHLFMLRDLEPGIVYTYRVNEGDLCFFSTPVIGGALHFAMGSDAHFGAGDNRLDLTAEMLAKIADPANGYDLFFYGGDLVEHGFSPSQWGEAFRAMSTTTASVPTRYIIGNHESLFTGYGLFKKLLYPREMDLQTGSQLWYRIDVGKIHFLCLDIEWSAESFTKTQSDWLENQLKDIPADDWKIVINHGFYYSSGSLIAGWNWFDNPETIDALAPLFEKYGVDMVLCGHNHQMEFLQHNGVTYAVCAAFGGLPDPERTYTSPASLWYKNGALGFLDITVKNNNSTIIFRDPDYQALATFDIVKHQ
jgi:acid phosphatase type 7